MNPCGCSSKHKWSEYFGKLNDNPNHYRALSVLICAENLETSIPTSDILNFSIKEHIHVTKITKPHHMQFGRIHIQLYMMKIVYQCEVNW